MKKNIIMISVVLGLIVLVFSISYTIDLNGEKIKIDGTTYAIIIDGQESDNIPLNGNYYLDSYKCANGSIITWDYYEHDLYIEKIKTNSESCLLNFKSGNLPLAKMQVGDYVAYVGNNGCLNGDTGTTGIDVAESGNSCKGYNANQPTTGTEDERGHYGYCYDGGYHYITYGWRIAYIEDGKVYLISAGSPECRTRTSSTNNDFAITDLNTAALKYCNKTYVDGGVCPTTASESNAVRALGNIDFEKITYAISGTTSSLTAVYGTTFCISQFPKKRCGYGNDLLDNGGHYWFAAHNNSTDGVQWIPSYRNVDYTSLTLAYGLRPIIRLSSSVYVTGGSGTMEDPWQIGI